MSDVQKGPHFGPRIVGEAAYQAEATKVRRGAHHFGPRVTGTMAVAPASVPAPPDTPDQALPPEPAGLSVKQLQEAVGENPELVDRLLAAEQARAEGPRKGALRALIDAEAKRAGGGRPEVIDGLADLLSGGT